MKKNIKIGYDYSKVEIEQEENRDCDGNLIEEQFFVKYPFLFCGYILFWSYVLEYGFMGEHSKPFGFKTKMSAEEHIKSCILNKIITTKHKVKICE